LETHFKAIICNKKALQIVVRLLIEYYHKIVEVLDTGENPLLPAVLFANTATNTFFIGGKFKKEADLVVFGIINTWAPTGISI
jgi:hypothetical protein